MVFIRKYTKAFIFFLLVLSFLVVSYTVDLLIGNKRKKLGYFSKIASFMSKLALIILGVRVKTRNLSNLARKKENYLIVSNHLTYMDVFVISTVVPSVFIANSELKEQFPLGAVTKYSGGVFVERRNRASLLKDMENIKDILNIGFDMVLFPEATTSDGEKILKFRTPFLTSAIESNVNIQPICLKYRELNGSAITPSNKHIVYFYEGLGFFDHFFRLLEQKSISVEVEELETIVISPESSRKAVSDLAYKRISDAYFKHDTNI
jgi:lyso-ornithine lipid O-acyltransferase